MLPRQFALDALLACEQPVHGGIQVVLVQRPQPERLGQGVVGASGGQAAGGGQCGPRLQHAGHDQGQHALALRRGLRGDEAVEAKTLERAEHGRDGAMGARVDDVESLVEARHGGAALEPEAQAGD